MPDSMESQGYGGPIDNGRVTVLFGCFAGRSANDILTYLRARWLWDDREKLPRNASGIP